ncbi:hypothetical protein F511_33107 [Dorcoceras hygrometricum]|uniref:Uncharacterized protein n=1 Tax=Dorcoceras hygrometricum TaxID=472368 RepID=A0A2Z7CDA3_9LAMI|nr:hypothetical protein F511_33107 [Dorcoceras hygrometricum]
MNFQPPCLDPTFEESELLIIVARKAVSCSYLEESVLLVIVARSEGERQYRTLISRWATAGGVIDAPGIGHAAGRGGNPAGGAPGGG